MQDDIQNKINLWPSQEVLLQETKHRDHVLAAGVGYGKSILGCRWLFYRMLKNAKPLWYAICAPTYKLVRSVNLEQFKELLKSFGLIQNVHFVVNLSDLTLTFNVPPLEGARVYFITANNYKTILAFTFCCIWVDEPGWMDDEVYPELIKRVRDGQGRIVQTLRTGVPQGSGESVYFKDCTEGKFKHISSYDPDDSYLPSSNSFTRFKSDGKKLIMHASTHENKVNDNSYIDRIYDQIGYSKNLWLQQVHGQFVSASSSSLFDFEESTHVGQYKPNQKNDIRWLSWDFNVGQVTWLCMEQKNGVHYVVAENGSNARDTIEACEQFKQIFSPKYYRHNHIIIVGDCSGHSRDTRTRSSDYKLIEEYLSPYYPNIQIKAPNRNPDISMSIIATNRLFNELPNTGKPISLYIDSFCRKLIRSLVLTEADSKGGIKKPSGETWTHPSDALRYYVWEVEPLRKRSAGGISLV